MDGTLIDSTEVVPDAYIDAVLAFGGPRLQRDEVVARYSIGPPAMLLSHFLGRPVTSDEVATYHSILQDKGGGVRPYDGIAEVLARLDGRVPLAVFTGATRRAAEILLEAAGLAGYFKEIVGGDQVERSKPAPDGILRACHRIGVAPADAAYIGDSRVDVAAALACEALAAAAAWGHQYVPGERCDVVLSSPEEALGLVAVP
jgi:HAD superfamily hydrolase (TIGR01509 family)